MAQTVFALIALALTVASYATYLRDIDLGHTRPHAISWLIWSAISAITFVAQIQNGAEQGAWVMATTTAVTALVFALTITKRERTPTVPSDWVCLAGVVAAAGLWRITDSPLIAVVIVTGIDALAYAPTFRKTYSRPFEETLSTHVLACLKYVLAVLALGHVTLVTALYPVSVVIMDTAFIALLVIRRRQLPDSDHRHATSNVPELIDARSIH